MTSFNPDIDLHALLSECCKLALLAGKVIQEVHRERVAGGNSVLGGHLKEDGDAKSVATIADIRAQRVIVTSLRRKFPGLCIVGEEEEDETILDGGAENTETNTEEYLTVHPFFASHCLDSLGGTGDSGSLKLLRLDSVVVYIDPLDGTHEFVEGRVGNVQTLIGIAVNGYPIAGAIGLPFWEQARGDHDQGVNIARGRQGGAVIAGVVGVGTCGFVIPTHKSSPMAAPLSLKLASSESIKHPALVAVQGVLMTHPVNASAVVKPACGNKILSLLRRECDVAVFNLKTSLWDTCATQALLVAAGGRVTDLVGCSINHSHPSLARGGDTGNPYGVIATVSGVDHSDLVRRLRALPEVTALFAKSGLIQPSNGNASATDVCRDTFGLPLSTVTLSQLVGASVQSYCCPEEDAQRYLMSEAARVYLTYESQREEFARGRPASLFYKRAVMRDLPHVAVKAQSAPAKLKRDVQSYLVEASFLASNACQVLSGSPGVCVAKCRKAEICPNDIAIDSKFSLLLEDFSPSLGWLQAPLLDADQLRAGIEALAKFHAFFWNGGVHNRLLSAGDVEELQRGVWGVASHWAPSRQPAEMMDQIAEIWAKRNYGDATVGFGDGSQSHILLGERLQRVARVVASECHFDGQGAADLHPHRTIIHGDAKAGNLFYRNSHSGNDLNRGGCVQPSLSVGLIDFQWTGFGLGATDIAYYIASSAGSSTVDTAGVKEHLLLQVYHNVLTTELSRLSDSVSGNGSVSGNDSGNGSNTANIPIPTLAELESQYESGLLDICRIAFAYHWERIPASPQVFTPERKAMLGPCAYNKDADVARWLVARCDFLLSKRNSKNL